MYKNQDGVGFQTASRCWKHKLTMQNWKKPLEKSGGNPTGPQMMLIVVQKHHSCFESVTRCHQICPGSILEYWHTLQQSAWTTLGCIPMYLKTANPHLNMSPGQSFLFFFDFVHFWVLTLRLVQSSTFLSCPVWMFYQIFLIWLWSARILAGVWLTHVRSAHVQGKTWTVGRFTLGIMTNFNPHFMTLLIKFSLKIWLHPNLLKHPDIEMWMFYEILSIKVVKNRFKNV
jgi:hypothetical protein